MVSQHNVKESHQLTLRVNGQSHTLQVESRESLLDVLRERLGLTGTKKGCNQGACGACTVLVDGERINSCFALAVQYGDREVQTVEGLAHDGELHPLQRAFIQHDSFQCGYCTPGQICSGIGMLQEFREGMPSAVSAAALSLSPEEVKERMSGNLCRCGAYVGIRKALQDYAQQENVLLEERA
jgi:xanthine dehydrogenase YagT iron-sulfur-binding subunit